MPRHGKGKQPIQAAPGQPYGDAKDQKDAQKVTPLPDVNTTSSVIPLRGQGGRERMLEQARDFAGPLGSKMSDLSNRPNEPVTAGMRLGAGPGPEALLGAQSRRAASQRVFSNLADTLGDPRLRRLAGRSR